MFNGNLGITLSSGGLRGAAHIGVLKELEKHNIYPNYISGTSIGSIIACLICVGYSIEEIERLFITYQDKKEVRRTIFDIDILNAVSFVISIFTRKKSASNGFIKGNLFERIIDKLCIHKKRRYLSDSLIPIAIPAVNLKTDSLVIFVSDKKMLKNIKGIVFRDDVTFAEAVRASISLPIVYQAKKIDGMILVDGGLKPDYTADVLSKYGASNIIKSNIQSYSKFASHVDDISSIATRFTDIMIQQIQEVHNKVQHKNTININLSDVKILDFSKINICITAGQVAASRFLAKLRNTNSN